MSAQDGSHLALLYKPQGPQQSGGSITLLYGGSVAPLRKQISTGFALPWGAAGKNDVQQRAPFSTADLADVPRRAPWARGARLQRASRAQWLVAARSDHDKRGPWGQYARRAALAARAPWGTARREDQQADMPWGSYARRLAAEPTFFWLVARPQDHARAMPWGSFAARPALLVATGWNTAKPAGADRYLPWSRYSRQLAPGWGVVTPSGEIPTDENGTVLVPIRRVSIVLNTITLNRVDTGAPLRAHAFSASLDFASWTWSWSASLHHDAQGLLGRDSAGDPAELQAVVNGVPLRLRLESIELDERFLPQKRWAVSGRGKASILAAPHAPTMSFGSTVDRTAQQLAADVLTFNGVGIGWTLDWGIADWLVPAGAWAMRGSYIDAINDIAAAAGGYVQAHPTDAVLRVLPRYPLPPWEWGSITPAFEIPRGAAEVVGTKFVDKPAYNGVYVGGESVGVFGPFKRTGTDGATLAPQVTHPLITHSDAHRARAIAEISDTGSQEHITLSMQVLAETGLIVPGQFVRYVGDRTVMGIVRRTSIDLNRPKLRQTIAIETHVAD